MKKVLTVCIVLVCLIFAGCSSSSNEVSDQVAVLDENQMAENRLQSVSENTYHTGKALLADSLDTAVIESINDKEKTIVFWNLTRGLSYTLHYDSATSIKDCYDQELVAGQLKAGDVVKVTFLKEDRIIKNIWIDKTVTVMEEVNHFVIHNNAKTMEIDEKRYAIDPCVSVLSNKQKLTLMDINEADTLTVYALDHTILSMVITNEHGYVRLNGAESFEGGFVEFGQTNIYKVEADMLLVLPSGDYEMFISHKGNKGTKAVSVLPGQETTVDVSDLVMEEDKREGGIVFTITPQDATLFIDGKETDFSGVVTLGYGIHQMKLKKDGYKTISQYIKVGAQMANIDMQMEPSNGSSEDEKDSVSQNTIAAADGQFLVYIDAPIGAELYVDGSYVGVVPTSFEKKQGKYTVSLRRSGYITRSYSLEVDDSKKDVHYTFSQLQEDLSTAILDYATGLGI